MNFDLEKDAWTRCLSIKTDDWFWKAHIWEWKTKLCFSTVDSFDAQDIQALIQKTFEKEIEKLSNVNGLDRSSLLPVTSPVLSYRKTKIAVVLRLTSRNFRTKKISTIHLVMWYWLNYLKRLDCGLHEHYDNIWFDKEYWCQLRLILLSSCLPFQKGTTNWDLRALQLLKHNPPAGEPDT